MKKLVVLLVCSCCFILAGCQLSSAETMTLLDEKIANVHISHSEGFGGMNEEIIQTFDDKQSIKKFEQAIKTAILQSGKADVQVPDYDVMVEYVANDGQLPTHGIHLWLGEENKKSLFMYIGDDVVYQTSKSNTNELREMIVPGK